jgi:hypothetical protein
MAEGYGVVLMTADDGSLPVTSPEDAKRMLEERHLFEMDQYERFPFGLF